MPFLNVSAQTRHPRYQEYWNRFSRSKVMAVGSWLIFVKSEQIPGSHAPKSSNLMNLCETLYTGSPKSELLWKKCKFFVYINSRKLYRVRTSPWFYMMFGYFDVRRKRDFSKVTPKFQRVPTQICSKSQRKIKISKNSFFGVRQSTQTSCRIKEKS